MNIKKYFNSSHAPAWEFSLQRSSVADNDKGDDCLAGRRSVRYCIPTPERGNDNNDNSHA